MQWIVEDLVEKSNALGAWIVNGHHELAAATKDPSVPTPRAYADGEAYLELGGMQVLVQPVGSVLLIVMFEKASSLGLVRLRVKQAKEALIRELSQ